MKVAIHTVFIAKENIMFLEEWIDYHMLLGFDYFYLYDNSKCEIPGPCDVKNKNIKLGRINKYNINYGEIVKLTPDEVNDKLQQIVDKYKYVEIIDWSPLNSKQKVIYDQAKAHTNCLHCRLKPNNFDWCANIDMDEYIVIKNFTNIKDYITSKPGISNINMGQHLFESRFKNQHQLVTQNTDSQQTPLPRNHSNKNIYKVTNTRYMGVHKWIGDGIQIRPPISEIWFNHYKITTNPHTHKTIDNIHPEIKQQLLINSTNYIKI